MLDGLPCRVCRVRRRSFFQKPQYLIHLRCEEVERGQDPTVRAEVILLHDFLVVDRVSDVYVALEGDSQDGRVEVDDIRWLFPLVKIGVYALHESCLARTCDRRAH